MSNATVAPNRLIHEKSPYLLQHANNPVDWYPWCDDAFEKARRENKPIFLSIGYSTCHWCHVMENESFEDEEVAKLMNDNFISIKVDREERPDIDNIYMSACQAITGSGGWPLTILMTWNKKPFYAATYIPKQSRYGGIGMIELINNINEMWKKENGKLIEYSEEVERALGNMHSYVSGDGIYSETLDVCFQQLESMYDERHGGFGKAPKFPTPHNLLFLLRYHKRTGNKKALNMVLTTLDDMYSGGIFDQIGYGFHRYSTDRQWIVPHFEKMLYDQAMISMACIETYQLTGLSKYKDIADKIFLYLEKKMKADEGCFFSAEDADSEGEEGKFYVWSIEEIRNILDEDEVEIAIKAFNIKEEGNFKDEINRKALKLNIPHLNKSLLDLSKQSNLSIEEYEEKLKAITNKLYVEREKRIHPFRDDKILTDWNSLVIASLAKAGRAFNNEKYVKLASKAADFLIENIQENGRPMHRYKDGEWKYQGNIDDYSFLIYALIELYETTFDTTYLRQAMCINDQLLELFWDKDNGGFYFTAEDDENILVRTKEIYDGAVPSGNSIELLNLIKLSRITGDFILEQYADKLQKAFSDVVCDSPISYTQLLVGIDYLIGPSYEVVIAGNDKSEDALEMLSILNSRFIPNMTVIFYPSDEERPDILDIAEYIENQSSIGGKATAYVCKNSVCYAPTMEIEQLLKDLDL